MGMRGTMGSSRDLLSEFIYFACRWLLQALNKAQAWLHLMMGQVYPRLLPLVALEDEGGISSSKEEEEEASSEQPPRKRPRYATHPRLRLMAKRARQLRGWGPPWLHGSSCEGGAKPCTS